MKATKKPVTIDFYTWEEVVKMGLEANPESIHGEGENARAWNFMFHNKPLTLENDECYLIPNNTSPTGSLRFTPDDVLIIQIDGEVYPCKKDIFEMTYDIENPALQGETFEDRLRKEFLDLKEKAWKLHDSLYEEHGQFRKEFREKVGDSQHVLLCLQLNCMNSYLYTLGMRLEKLGIDPIELAKN